MPTTDFPLERRRSTACAPTKPLVPLTRTFSIVERLITVPKYRRFDKIVRSNVKTIRVMMLLKRSSRDRLINVANRISKRIAFGMLQ